MVTNEQDDQASVCNGLRRGQVERNEVGHKVVYDELRKPLC